MIQVVGHIEYLLTKHDCVILPGWGAFLSQFSSAELADDDFTFMKPQRSISFNESISHNDGLLATSLMRKESVSYDEAVAMIANNVESLKQQLNHEGSLAMGRIGVFRKNDNNGMTFEPFLNSQANNEFYGLHSLSLKPLISIAQEDKAKAKRQAEVARVNWLRRYSQIAASIVVLLGLTFMLSTPIENNNAEQAGLNISKVILTPKIDVPATGDLAIVMPPVVEIDSAKIVADSIEAAKKEAKQKRLAKMKQKNAIAKNKAVAKQAKKTKQVEIASNAPKTKSNGKCQLVVASLRSKEDANKFVASHHDSRLRVVESNGKYRVCIGSGSYEEMSKMKISVSGKHPKAWVCKN